MLGHSPLSDQPLSGVPAPVASGVSGTLATTNANDTLAAAGSPVIVGTLARTNANDTSTASGSPVIVGTSSTTNADDTLAASGSSGLSVTGTLAYTNNDDTVAAIGWAGIISSTLATTNANDTLVAVGEAGENLIGRKRPRRRRQLPVEIPAEKLPEILEQVSEEKDYLNEALAAAHTELTLAALSTDNAERRTQKLRKLGTDIALLEMELAEAEDEEAFLILVLQAARVLI